MERPPSPIVVDGEEEFEVEAILRHKGSGARRLYQVLWKGYPITKASWEPESHLHNTPQILEEYPGDVSTSATVESRQPEDYLMVFLRIYQAAAGHRDGNSW